MVEMLLLELQTLWSKLHHDYWKIGDGRDVVALHNAWTDVGWRVSEQNVNIPAELYDVIVKVCDIVDDEGNWKWSLLCHWLLESILRKMHAILPTSDDDNGSDVLVHMDQFSVAGMYNIVSKFNTIMMGDLAYALVRVARKYSYKSWV
ncbi:hypothetical protein TSUD_103430 [Trifolium subterraneum]|uniref:Uncharacterized protein n=1 Tax=Trifolium subterraneum TaxID=3900 RepID=A0A2Z6NFB3_TRISU|nr:hypothetical protein TSUD_103430 [Trifolium subterraneum]